MVDETQKEEAKTEAESEADENSKEGVQPEERTIVDDANEAAERLKAENDRKEALIKKEEELAARRALGGKTAGPQKEEKKEKTDAEFKDEFMRGEHPFPDAKPKQ